MITMKKAVFSIFFILLLGLTFADNDGKADEPANASAKTIELIGKVVDIHSGEALVGVEINIEGSDRYIICNVSFERNLFRFGLLIVNWFIYQDFRFLSVL